MNKLEKWLAKYILLSDAYDDGDIDTLYHYMNNNGWHDDLRNMTSNEFIRLYRRMEKEVEELVIHA